MECHCLPVSKLPHTTRLFSAFLEDFERVAGFYAHPPSMAGVLRAAREVPENPDVRRAMAEILRDQNRRLGADGATERSLDRLAAGAVAVVTGQQVGLFSGPSYTMYKALSTLRVAEELSAQGTAAVPIFWLATEDHDLAEINHCFWLGRGELRRIEVAGTSATGHSRSVGRIALGDGGASAVRAAAELLDGPSAEEIARALEECYRPEETFGTAFGKLLARLFAGRGIILLDPLDPRVQKLAAPIYHQAITENSVLTQGLLKRNKRLEQAGYHAQVKVTERSTLVFLHVDGERQPLRRKNEGFVAGRAEFSTQELLELLRHSPEAFSANVLLRPVVQDFLLPTAAYVAGPAETAYFAQAEVVYRRLLERMPAVVARAGFTLVEPHVARLLKRYNLELRDVLHGRQYLRAKLEREFLTRSLSERFDVGEKSVRKLLAGLRRPLGKLDQTLLGALDTAERKMLYQFQRLRGKAGRAENFRTGVLDAHEQQIVESLYPHHGLQERTLCFLPLLARHGPTLLRELSEQTEIGNVAHRVLFL